MIEAVLAFGVYLGLAAITLLIFWALQIRFGQIEDLDPNNPFVQWFSRKSASVHLNPEEAELISGSTPSIGLTPSPIGTVAFAAVLATILPGDAGVVAQKPFENEAWSAYTNAPDPVVYEVDDRADLR